LKQQNDDAGYGNHSSENYQGTQNGIEEVLAPILNAFKIPLGCEQAFKMKSEFHV
jgi:hypothetical protein